MKAYLGLIRFKSEVYKGESSVLVTKQLAKYSYL